MRFICSFGNEKGHGRAHYLFSDDDAAIEAFARRFDVPGRGVFECVAELRAGAQRRSLSTVASLSFVHVDIDFRALATSREEILKTLKGLPLRPRVHDSGGGFHVIFPLKEPAENGTEEFERVSILRSQLTRLLCGDPAPNHAAALLRRVGTHNSKYGEPRLCHVVEQGEEADITDLEALLDEYGDAQLFAYKPKANGHGGDTDFSTAGPVDVDQRLAAMRHQGAGDTGVHITQLACTAALLRSDTAVGDVVEQVLKATKQAVAGDPECAGWDWGREKLGLERMCYDFISKHHPELFYLLPEELAATWLERLDDGHTHLKVTRLPRSGWFVTSLTPIQTDDEPASAAHEPHGDSGDAEPHSEDDDDVEEAPKQAPRKPTFALRPFVPFDIATLPPRQWLYGRHYQRGTVSATVAPGGFGKTR